MVKLLNVKAMEKVIESKNYNKIVGGVIGERYSVEAIDYLLKEATKNEEFVATYTFDHIIHQLSYNKGSYKFSNFFKDYEEYVYSAFVKAIFEKRNTGDYITWFDFFPSEEEIKRLYSSATPEMKSVIYKTLVYRRTSYALGTEFFDLYADSYNVFLKKCLLALFFMANGVEWVLTKIITVINIHRCFCERILDYLSNQYSS